MHRPVLIMSALPQELAALQAAASRADVAEIRGHEFHRGVIDSHDVVMATGGIGKVNAAMVATLALDHFDVRAV
ncbi:MAG: 5'-methylthioadenosine/adenosylhomocysteine nucleosidase, partial [Acidimicrobiia bacterium]|nr:5'-methylthioadenosine/adenosylhomocysteine nucleosidase [Acidimicrobiia bacterium]